MEVKSVSAADGKRVYYKGKLNTTTGLLNARTGPGTSDNIGFNLPKGTIVDVMFEYDNDWVLVDEDGDQGYVRASFLDKIETVTNEPSPEEKQTTLTRADGACITLIGEWEII